MFASIFAVTFPISPPRQVLSERQQTDTVTHSRSYKTVKQMHNRKPSKLASRFTCCFVMLIRTQFQVATTQQLGMLRVQSCLPTIELTEQSQAPSYDILKCHVAWLYTPRDTQTRFLLKGWIIHIVHRLHVEFLIVHSKI